MTCVTNGFQDRRIRPLCHLSVDDRTALTTPGLGKNSHRYIADDADARPFERADA
jgi:hypothetical protein